MESEHGGSEGEGEHGDSEGEGEHGASGGHDSGEEGEESGVYIGRDDTWDATRRGARLVLSFDPATNAFVGTVENTTRETLCAVRVEVVTYLPVPSWARPRGRISHSGNQSR